MKKLIIFLTFLSFRLSAQEIETCLKPVIDTRFICASNDIDGGWVAGGICSSWGSFFSGGYFAKFDSLGNKIFNNIFTDGSGEEEYVIAVISTDTGYLSISQIINCCDCGAGGKILVRRINSSGIVSSNHTLISYNEGFLWNSKALIDTNIFIGIEDSVFCFNSSFNLKWKKSIAPFKVTDIFIIDTLLILSKEQYAPNQRGMTLLNRSNGSLINQINFNIPYYNSSSIFINDTIIITGSSSHIYKINLLNNSVIASASFSGAKTFLNYTDGFILVNQYSNSYSKLIVLNNNLQVVSEYPWEEGNTRLIPSSTANNNFVLFGSQINGNGGSSSFIKEFDFSLNTANNSPDIGVSEVMMDSSYVYSFYHFSGYTQYYFKVRTSVKVQNFSNQPINNFNLSWILDPNGGICNPPAGFQEISNSNLQPFQDTIISLGWITGVGGAYDTSLNNIYEYQNCFWTATPNNKIDSNSENDTYCDSINVFLPVGLNEIGTLENNLSVFPNPAFNQLTCSFTSDISGNAFVVFSTLLGQVIFSGNKSSNQGVNTYTFDLSELSSGNYILSLVLPDGNILRKKLIKQ